MHETLQSLIRQLDHEDIEDAKRMPAALKFRAGGDLFDDACRPADSQAATLYIYVPIVV